MISFAKIMQKVLTERMSFRDLYSTSTPDRVDRSKSVRSKSLRVTSMDGQEAWTFSYKSSPSTTGHRWHGYVRFLKDNVEQAASAADLDCMVDCDCPDYRYRFAYNNAKEEAGAIGPNSWNQNNGQPPRPREQGGVGDYGTGMCKHLISIGEYLKTNIEPTAPEPPKAPTPVAPKVVPTIKAPEPKPSVPSKPTSNAPQPAKKPVAVKPAPLVKKSPIDAPSPEDTVDDYTDSRSGDLQENVGQVGEKLTALVKSKPEFEVWYEDDEDEN